MLGAVPECALRSASRSWPSHRISPDKRIAALRRARDIPYRPERSRLSVGEFRAGLADRVDHPQFGGRPAHSSAFDRGNARLVRDVVGFRRDQSDACGDGLPRICGYSAEHVYDLCCCDPDAYSKRTLARPRDGGADDGDIRPAAWFASGGQPDRSYRLFCNRHTLCGCGVYLDDGDRTALALGSLASARASKCAVKG